MKTEIVTNLKRRATEILADLHSTKQPVLITEHGQPSAYLVDVEDYEFTKERLAMLEGIAKGEAALANQQILTHADAKEKMSKWLK